MVNSHGCNLASGVVYILVICDNDNLLPPPQGVQSVVRQGGMVH